MKIREPLYLSVKFEAWREDGQWESNKDIWQKIRQDILDRDHHTCGYCGFPATKFQEVHHIDNDHDNNSEENLVTICSLCHACHHIGLAGALKRGTLVYLPEITQQDLHWMIRWISLSVYSDDMGGYLDTPRRMFSEFLIHRKKMCEARMGTSDPVTIGNTLLKFGETAFSENATRALTPIRMVPALIGDKDIDYLHGYDEERKKHWKEQMKLLVPDMTQIMEYINAGVINKN
ncbi:MAG TPA: type IVB secretion system protein IcmJDotN [Ignavibacteriaceae bacterium]